MSSIIDEHAIRSAPLRRTPYRYAVLADSFTDPALTRRLGAEFPREGFALSDRERAEPGQKRYRTFDHQLVRHDRPHTANLAALSPLWQQLVAELRAPGYRAALASLVPQAPDDLALEVRLTRYGPGCWIEPHTDRPDKVVTHLFYFNTGWQSAWQGDFRVLNGPDIEDVADRVRPALGTSLIMIRSDRSWHGVPPVSADCPQDRLTLLVHLHHPDGAR
ncbi:2OG-Fe(II) oxygenase [Kitasatospora viridis]|uniref:2-oxoglutarate-Fe(II)-dependent oxygenase superfamily protein n=1 Tax=Kitasatospora viridis TaxID=281105 RepID=A0A561T693_9ACTN|nr:2OG-Fe(II) oxygenase [Kitasatospora viridis]TWF82635.1 2-oxoglutarate-Fe(II)-dependent oxygenase superfamily protein [Kitasatospora viridis]